MSDGSVVVAADEDPIERRMREREQQLAESNAKTLAEWERRREAARTTAEGLEPLMDRILVLRATAAEMTAGGVVLPEGARGAPCEGEVLRVGGAVDDIEPGERVIFSSYSGAEVQVDGSTMLILSSRDVMLVRRVRS